ncbi:hypothetical protein O181_000659 [Austropuccinia psidii MF-1]|uniref:Chromo domain-containing protein n=1 Tax=Austropuccinia psidii MF-1 TaxID=1389203 RepID=A0A9Q3GB46_9BASI|nr:hypothetical protein [Austropuccinia psidii MF-1]
MKILNIHPTAKDFNDMWKNACDKAAIFIAEAKQFNKKSYDKTHKEPDFREDDQVLISPLNFNNLKCPKKMRDQLVVPFTIIRFLGMNAVEVRLTEEFTRKHPVFPVSLVKPYHQTRENRLASIINSHTPQDIVEGEDSPGPVKNIIKARKIRLNGKDHRQYWVRFKDQKADQDNLLEEDAILDVNLFLRRFVGFGRAEESYKI